MGQKVHPIGYRLGVVKKWSSNWYANTKNYSQILLADIQARQYIVDKWGSVASISRIEIKRPAKNAQFIIYCGRPAALIGKKGEDLERLRADLAKRIGVPVFVTVEEIRKPELDARLVAEGVAQQLVKRIMFRRAMKRSVTSAMRAGAKGIKIMVSGRLGGAEIARTEWIREGRVPLHTLRADIDYAEAQAKTTYGIIGVKVWIFKGEVIGQQATAEAAATATAE